MPAGCASAGTRRRSGRGRVAGQKPSPDRPSDAVPLALLEVEAPMPGSVLLCERPFLRVVGVISHHLVGHGLDFLAGNKAREDRPLVDYPADADHDGRHRDRNRQPFHSDPKPVIHFRNYKTPRTKHAFILRIMA